MRDGPDEDAPALIATPDEVALLRAHIEEQAQRLHNHARDLNQLREDLEQLIRRITEHGHAADRSDPPAPGV